MKDNLRYVALPFLLLLGALLVPMQGASNMMTLRFAGGTEKSADLDKLSKITFSGNNMVMAYSDGSFENYDLLSLLKIGFTISNAISESYAASARLSIVGSPSSGQITLVNIPEGARQACIYGLDGQLILREDLTSTSQLIDVSSLPDGFYLIRVNNGTAKFVKQ